MSQQAAYKGALHCLAELTEPALAFACSLWLQGSVHPACCLCGLICLLMFCLAVGVIARCDLMKLHAQTSQIATRCVGRAALLVVELVGMPLCRWLSVLSQWQTRQLTRFRRRLPAWLQKQCLQLTRRQTS